MGGILEPVSCPTIVLSKNALQAKRLIVCLQLSGDPSVHTILPHSLGSAANFFVGGRCSGQVETQVLRQQLEEHVMFQPVNTVSVVRTLGLVIPEQKMLGFASYAA